MCLVTQQRNFASGTKCYVVSGMHTIMDEPPATSVFTRGGGNTHARSREQFAPVNILTDVAQYKRYGNL